MATKMIFVALCLAICLIYVNAREFATESGEKCYITEFRTCRGHGRPGEIVNCEKRHVCQFTCMYNKSGHHREVTHRSPNGTPCKINGRPAKCDGRGNCKLNRSAETSSQCD